MINLIKCIAVCAIMSNVAFAQSPVKHIKTKIFNPKQALDKAFVGTDLKDRIVKVSLPEQKDKRITVTIIWHPQKIDNMLDDMLVIMETVSKTIPAFHSVSLQAVRRACVEDSKTIIWKASISKMSFSMLQERRQQRTMDIKPIPLFQE